MWCIALLIHASTWNEFLHNWKLICKVFIELHLGQDFINKEHQEALIDKISKIKNDTNTRNIIKSTDEVSEKNTENLYFSSIYDFDETDDEAEVQLGSNVSKSNRKKKMVIDEEQQVNSMDSPFKSTITKLFHDVLSLYSISMKQVNDKSSRGILRWFKYLINSFMPTTPIWCNLLLGNLTRHTRQIINLFESISIINEEQLTTAISERRMCIVKRIQLVPDMMLMIDEYWSALLGYSTSNDKTICIDQQRLKPIQERWREKVSRRGAGFYNKRPSEPIVNDLISCLLSPKVNINENLKLPILSPVWLDVAVGILLSVGNNNPDHYIYMSSLKSSPLLSKILKFLEQWYNSSNKTNVSTNLNISSLNIKLNDAFEQSSFILEYILIPVLPCQMIICKIHECSRCKLTTKIHSIITSIPINISVTGLSVEKNLFAYFAPTQSDLVCSNCNTATMRRIEVQQWPQVLLLHLNDSKQVTRPQRPPSMLSLGQFSSWNAIGFPSSSLYHLTCFTSVVKSGNYDTMVRTTKIKKNWRTSLHNKTIGTLVFERMCISNRYNLVHAVIHATGLKCSSLVNDIPQSISVQDALKFIQTHPLLCDLKNALTADVKTNRYNDRATIIKQKDSSYVQFYGDTYAESSDISISRIADLIDTCNSILLFYQQSRTTVALSTNITTTPSTNTTTTSSTNATTTPSTNTTATLSTNILTSSTTYNNSTSNSSQMRIVSQVHINGVQRLVITDGNRFFSITAPSKTNTN
ncbi:unnamed protein product [Rotaria sp. Silwood1]|nr:unnamed protein product [Rotaria sp. Silwood1]